MQKHLLSKTLFFIIISVSLSTICYSSQATALDEALQQAETLKQYLSFDKLINVLTGNIIDFFKSIGASFGLSVCIILISGVMTAFKDSFSKYEAVFDIISDSALILSVLPTVIICCQTAERTVISLCGFMTSFVPVGGALLASSGSPVSAATSSLYGAFMINSVQLISVSLVLPCIKAIFSVTAINVLCKNQNLSGITSFFKSSCLWLVGLSFTLLTGIYSLQTLLSSSADNLTLKGLRFSASRLIPIAGGMISESMKTVISSMGYIKSVSGIGAIVFTIYTLALPLCAIICTKLYLTLLSALSKAINIEGASKLFDGFSSDINVLAALLLGCGVSFIIMLAMFINITVSI